MQTNGLRAATAFVFLSRLSFSSPLSPGSDIVPASCQGLEPTARKIQEKNREFLLIPMNKSLGSG